jgi:hypothetical protein
LDLQNIFLYILSIYNKVNSGFNHIFNKLLIRKLVALIPPPRLNQILPLQREFLFSDELQKLVFASEQENKKRSGGSNLICKEAFWDRLGPSPFVTTGFLEKDTDASEL